jgi:hypothetical protein
VAKTVSGPQHICISWGTRAGRAQNPRSAADRRPEGDLSARLYRCSQVKAERKAHTCAGPQVRLSKSEKVLAPYVRKVLAPYVRKKFWGDRGARCRVLARAARTRGTQLGGASSRLNLTPQRATSSSTWLCRCDGWPHDSLGARALSRSPRRSCEEVAPARAGYVW